MSSKVLKQQLSSIAALVESQATPSLSAAPKPVTKKDKAHRNFLRAQSKRLKATQAKQTAAQEAAASHEGLYARNLEYFKERSSADAAVMKAAMKASAKVKNSGAYSNTTASNGGVSTGAYRNSATQADAGPYTAAGVPFQQPAPAASLAAQLDVRGLTYHPAGVERPLISDVSFSLPAGHLGLIIGRSGSGKTTLLQILAGLCDQDKGDITLTHPSRGGAAAAAPSGPQSSPLPAAGAVTKPATMEERMQQVGLVFQFPERHFLGGNIFEELTFAWPRTPQYAAEREALTLRVQQAIHAVQLQEVHLGRAPTALSGGQQRRLALAIQLIRHPSLLLLDEPLAGLDWTARIEVVALLRRLKHQCTLLVVSHDMKEVAPLVDHAWRMQVGGTLEPEAWPPADVGQLIRSGR